MSAEELVELILENTNWYTRNELNLYSEKQLINIKHSLFIELKEKIQKNNRETGNIQAMIKDKILKKMGE